MKTAEFEMHVQNNEIILKKYTTLSSIIGYIKLSLVMLLGWLVYLNFFNEIQILLIILTGLLTIILIILWIYHNRVIEKINDTKGIIAINKRHLARISGDWISFADIGAEFINHDHPYSSDLDIVGQKSMFQFLNTTHTWYGRQAFADSLLHPNFSEDELEQRQKAIDELGEDISFSNGMENIFSKIGVHSEMRMLIYKLQNSELFLRNKTIKAFLLYFPIVTSLTSIIIIILLGQTQFYFIVASILFFQCFIWIIGMLKVKKYLQGIFHLNYNLDKYREVIKALAFREFRSDKLKEIKKQLTDSKVSASEAIKELEKIANKASVRHNAIAWFIMNVLLFSDYECAIRFEGWKLKYGVVAEEWFLALAEFESMMSFSHLANVCNATCLPSIVYGKQIEANELGHPLISNDKRISNDVACNNHIFIISGSNMSGKTTFMRTIGINLVLARSGSFVCAKSMNFTQLGIMTSMRIADSLNEGISTFYAELKRIKGIINFAQKNPNMIFLIDEIFRGTNSTDRLNGAKRVLTKLDELKVIGIITTHDLELCNIANDYLRIKNYSFAEKYYNNQIHFDYKMKLGKSTTTNAEYLMEMMDIL